MVGGVMAGSDARKGHMAGHWQCAEHGSRCGALTRGVATEEV